MKSLLLVGLLVLGTSAAPQRSEVELVQPRRVSTASAGADGASAVATVGGDGSGVFSFAPATRVNLGDILRSLGFGGRRSPFGSEFPRLGGRFPIVVDRTPSNCDSGRFQLSDEQYQVVTGCQLQREEGTLRECILNGLEDASPELKEFLSRDEYSVAGVSVSSSITIVGGEIEYSRMVSFRMCPRDEANAVDADTETGTGGDGADDTTAVYRPYRPVFQIPDIFGGAGAEADGDSDEEESPFGFNFDNMFRPFFQSGSDAGEGSLIPRIPDFDLDIDTDRGNCVSETFNLPKEAFKEAKKCRYGDSPFKQCLRSALEAVEDAKDLLEFVEDPNHQIVDTAFYQSYAAINGEVTRRYRVTLERCSLEESAEEGAVVPDEAGIVPAAEEAPETVVPEVIQGVPETDGPEALPEQPVYSPEEKVPINVKQPVEGVVEP